MGIIILVTGHLLHISFNGNYTTVSSCHTWRYIRASVLLFKNFLARLFFHSLSMGISVMSPKNQFSVQYHVIDIYRPILEQMW